MLNRALAAEIKDLLRRDEPRFLSDVMTLMRIPSVSSPADGDAPYGKPCLEALQAMLAIARRRGFEARCLDNRVGQIGSMEENAIEIWCHLDVVPAGDGWQLTEPFIPIVRDGFLIGRGGQDNKGSAVGVLTLLELFERLDVKTMHPLRLCVGTDEEFGMSDAEWYARTQPEPSLTVVADCGFPVCYGEKGIIEADIVSNGPMTSVTALQAGLATNIVPDSATMTVAGKVLSTSGQSGHSAFPEGNVNAIHELTGKALTLDALSENDRGILRFFHAINDDTLGTALDIDGSDALGATTCVGTMARLTDDGRAALHVNIRYRIGAEGTELIERMRAACAERGCSLAVLRISEPNRFPRENPVVDAMTDVYNEMTDDHAKPFTMGGATYARKLKNAVAFGPGLPAPSSPLFAPGHGGAHQPDESLHLEGLYKGLTILAMGLIAADGVLP